MTIRLNIWSQDRGCLNQPFGWFILYWTSKLYKTCHVYFSKCIHNVIFYFLPPSTLEPKYNNLLFSPFVIASQCHHIGGPWLGHHLTAKQVFYSLHPHLAFPRPVLPLSQLATTLISLSPFLARELKTLYVKPMNRTPYGLICPQANTPFTKFSAICHLIVMHHYT